MLHKGQSFYSVGLFDLCSQAALSFIVNVAENKQLYFEYNMTETT